MTAASGGSGEGPFPEGEPAPGGHEAPPIEDMPAYGSYPPPAPPPAYGPPAYGPPGYGPPGYPPPGYPPPGYGPGIYTPPPEYGAPYPGGYGYPAEYAGGPPGLNALSVASLVASVLWLCGFGSLAGVALGAIALNQIKRTRERGYGLAVAGIVVGVLGIVASLISLTFSTNTG